MNVVYKLYIECVWCTLFVDQSWCIQNLYKMFLYRIYSKFWQAFVYILYTKFSAHSTFNFVCKMYTKGYSNVEYILYIFCIYFLYISCILLAQFLYTKFIHSFHVYIKMEELKWKSYKWSPFPFFSLIQAQILNEILLQLIRKIRTI